MMDVTSMYGNHHPHHSNTYHAAGAVGPGDMSSVAAAAAANVYPQAYYPNTPAMSHGSTTVLHHQQSHHMNSGYISYDGSSPNYYQQQQQQQPQTTQQQHHHHQHPQPQQLTPPPSQPSAGHSQSLYTHSHSHLFSPTAAEYGITTSNTLAAATPTHPSNASHSPTDAVYYDNESVHAYYATAAVATVPPATTNSPLTAANASSQAGQNVPVDPPIISSENGLSYTNLDCLYNQNSPHQQSNQASSGYFASAPEEKYASVLHSQYIMDESLNNPTQNQQNQQHSPQLWHHHQHMPPSSYGHLDHNGLPLDSYNMHPHLHPHTMSQHLSTSHSVGGAGQMCGPQGNLMQHPSSPGGGASSSCGQNPNSRSQHVISPGGTTTTSTTSSASGTSASTSASSANGSSSGNPGQAKSPNQAGNNLPTYKWMQLKRNVPKPQGKCKICEIRLVVCSGCLIQTSKSRFRSDTVDSTGSNDDLTYLHSVNVSTIVY